MKRIGGGTKLAGIIGGPHQVQSSLSPAIHNAAFEALDLDWIYLGFPVEIEDVESALRGLAAAGVRGLNVTMPHKIAAAAVVDRLEGDASVIGAVNTIELRSGELIGWNTDAEGFVRFLRLDLGFEPRGASVLVLGAGGAARAIVAGLAGAGAASVTVAARDRSRADALKDLAGGARFASSGVGETAREASAADLIVNATPIGEAGESPLVEAGQIRPQATVVDLVYHPPSTPLVSSARERGVEAHNGLGMLIHQAALSFEIWTGLRPSLEAMSAAALGELSLGP